MSEETSDEANGGMTEERHRALVEASLSSHREHRDAAARWLAAEVLLADEAALADAGLVARLQDLQDRLEAQTRQHYGVA